MISFFSKPLYKWAFYDWANSVFATSIMAAFFPLFFKRFWASSLSINQSTQILAVGQSVSSLFIAFLSVLVAYLISKFRFSKLLFNSFVVLSVFSTFSLVFVQENNWVYAIVLFGFASIFFGLSNTLYDSFLRLMVIPSKQYYASLLGYSLGYAGGGLLFLVHVLISSSLHFFRIESFSEFIGIVVISVSIWWIAFSIPLMTYKNENLNTPQIVDFFKFKDLLSLKPILFFLIAYFFYMDGVWTIIKLAVDYGLSLGFDESHLLISLLITQVIGFPMTYIGSRKITRFDPVKVLIVLVSIYCGISIYAVFINSIHSFYFLAFLIGCIQGGVQGISRSYFSSLIPENMTYLSFSLYNFVGKFSAVLGPLLVVFSQVFFQNFTEDPVVLSRIGISSISILFIIGLRFLLYLNKINKYTIK